MDAIATPPGASRGNRSYDTGMRATVLKPGLAALAVACAFSQEPPVIEGIVVDTTTGAPVDGVLVNSVGRVPFPSVTSDGAGRFLLKPQKFGTCYLSASKDGYIGASQVPVQIKETAGEQRLTIHWTPPAAVEGAVLDDKRRPLPGVAVHLIPSALLGSAYAHRAVSGDDGGYRFERVAPGQYVVELKTSLAVRRGALARNAESGERTTLAGIQYWPAGDRIEAAGILHVPAGGRVTGVDAVLQRTPIVDLKVRLLDAATGEPKPKLHAELDSAGNKYRDAAFDCEAVDAHGERVFALIQPGRYRLLVYHKGCRQGLPVSLSLEVPARDMTEVELPAPSPVSITGIVKLPDGATQPPGPLRVILSKAIEGVAAKERTVEIGPDHRFQLDDVPPGPLAIKIGWARGTPNGWYVSRVRFGSQPPDDVIHVSEGGNPALEVELSDRGGTVSGRLSGGRVVPVVAITRNGARASTPTIIPVLRDGTFTLAGIPPGTYEVALPGAPDPSCKTERSTVVVEQASSHTVILDPCVR
jgi:hypothetical protein